MFKFKMHLVLDEVPKEMKENISMKRQHMWSVSHSLERKLPVLE